MQSFMSFLLEMEDKEKKLSSQSETFSSTEDVKKVKDIGLRLCLKWMFSKFGKKDSHSNEEAFIDSISVLDKSQVRKASYRLEINVDVEEKGEKKSREYRDECGSAIFRELEDNGPTFVDLPGKNYIDFFWFGNRNRANAVFNVSAKELGTTKDERSVASAGSRGASYGIGLYRCNGASSVEEAIDLLSKKVKDKKVLSIDNVIEEKEESGAIKLISFFDCTFKDKAAGWKSSEIKHTKGLMAKIGNVLGADTSNSSFDVLKPFKPSDYSNIVSGIKESFTEEGSWDKNFYPAFFEAIFENSNSKDFSMSKFVKAISDFDIMHISDRYPRLIVSEILVPMVLLAGYETIDKKKIIEATDADEKELDLGKLQTVEIPKSNTELLSDYNAVFLNFQHGKVAISAKLGDGGNAPSLFALIYNNVVEGKNTMSIGKEKQTIPNGNKTLKTIADIVSRSIERNDKQIKKAWKDKIVLVGEAILPEKDKSFYSMFEAEDYRSETAVFPKEGKAVLKKNGMNATQLGAAMRLYPSSLPLIYENKLLLIFNADKDFLRSVYAFVFGFYGEGVTFQQIQLNEDFSLSYIKQQDVSGDKIDECLTMFHGVTVSDRGKAINVLQPFRVKLIAPQV